MEPSVGRYDDTLVKALVMSHDGGATYHALVSLDLIGCDGPLNAEAYEIAVDMGLHDLPRSSIVFGASHSHSEPGAVAVGFLWSIAPAFDLPIPALTTQLATSIARALVEAQQKAEFAVMQLGSSTLPGVTHNRRGHYGENYSYVDDTLNVLRVDDASGAPLATLWNFAIHGICFDAPNMKVSSDVMGSVNRWIERHIGGTSMFFNADAGDVNPIFPVACKHPPGTDDFSGGQVIGSAVQKLRESLKVSGEVLLESYAHLGDFGRTRLNLTLARVANCTEGGPLDICSLCLVLKCEEDVHLAGSWLENSATFSAMRFTVAKQAHLLVSIPGEALTRVGLEIRARLAQLGYSDTVVLAGYANDYLGYFAGPTQYVLGGYESLLTFWGIDTSQTMINYVLAAAAGLDK